MATEERASAAFEADAYADDCSVCGLRQQFIRDQLAIRESYRCCSCRAILREREQARVLVRFFGRGKYACLAGLCRDPLFRTIMIYEPGTSGAFRRYLQDLPNYQQSSFYAENERHAATAQVPHESLEKLTFSPERFDLVLSSDILEHVRRPLLAIQEMYRILRPGGVNLFTVPLQEPLRTKTVWRVDTSGETDEFLLPKVYHGNGRGGRSLVYADYGSDLLDMLRGVGYVTGFVRPNTASTVVNRIVTVMAIRIC